MYGLRRLPSARQSPYRVKRTCPTRLRRERGLCPAVNGDDARQEDSENTIDDWGVASGKGSEPSIFKREFLFEYEEETGFSVAFYFDHGTT